MIYLLTTRGARASFVESRRRGRDPACPELISIFRMLYWESASQGAPCQDACG